MSEAPDQKQTVTVSEENSKGWQFWLRLIGVVIAALTLLGVGQFLYDEVWREKKLTYTVLPSYDLQDQFFTGLVVENRGRVTLTEVQIVITDLEASMLYDPYMPGAHEPATVASGGQGYTRTQIELPRLPKGASLPVYILTQDEVTLEEDDTFYLSSRETLGVGASAGRSGLVAVLMLIQLIAGISALGLVLWARFGR